MKKIRSHINVLKTLTKIKHLFLALFFIYILALSPAVSKAYPGLSPYQYCGGDPINLIDPTGEDIVVLHYKGTIGHLAMLIQNEDGKWQYYSVNGNNVNIPFTDIHIGGREFNDIAIGSWDSPQEFMTSSYNVRTENSKDDKSKNHFGYEEGYQISSTPEQDSIMRKSFTRISKTTYNMFTNNCATAVQQAMIDAGIPVSKYTKEPVTVPMRTPFGVVDTYTGEYRIKCDTSIFPSNAFKSIIKWNPGGKYIQK